MKNLTFHISHFTLHTLILLAGVMMFTACSDDDNSGGGSRAPYVEPITEWGLNPDKVKSMVKDYDLQFENFNGDWYYLSYGGKDNITRLSYEFYRDKLTNSVLILDADQITTEQILNFLNANYTNLDKPKAKTRTDDENINLYFASKHGYTEINFSDFFESDGKHFYKLRYYNRRYYDTELFTEPITEWGKNKQYIKHNFRYTIYSETEGELRYDMSTYSDMPYKCKYQFHSKDGLSFIELEFEPQNIDFDELVEMYEVRYNPTVYRPAKSRGDGDYESIYFLSEDGKTYVNLRRNEFKGNEYYFVDYFPVIY